MPLAGESIEAQCLVELICNNRHFLKEELHGFSPNIPNLLTLSGMTTDCQQEPVRQWLDVYRLIKADPLFY